MGTNNFHENKARMLTDDEFMKAFTLCQVDPADFNHEAHLRLAWIHISKFGIEQGIRNVCEQLLNYVRFVGAESKYNITVTIAAIHAVHHFMQRSQATNFEEFILANPRLKFHFKDIMASHYKTDICNNPEAKKAYLEPDLLPFD